MRVEKGPDRDSVVTGINSRTLLSTEGKRQGTSEVVYLRYLKPTLSVTAATAVRLVRVPGILVSSRIRRYKRNSMVKTTTGGWDLQEGISSILRIDSLS